MPKKIGIDLGTTNTVVCYEENGRPRYLRFGNEALLPSAVYVNEDGTFSVGGSAIRKGKLRPKRLITSSKTYMDKNDFVYPDSNPNLSFEVKLTPKDVAQKILEEVKRVLENRNIVKKGEQIDAVITVPAYFKSIAIQNTKEAASAAGFNVVKIISEPSAAAVAYITENIDEGSQIFVADFGGGTFDIIFLRYDPVSNEYIPMVSPGGNSRLGGDNIDEKVLDMLIDYIYEDTGHQIDLRNPFDSGLGPNDEYSNVCSKLKYKAREAKHTLSESNVAYVSVPDLFQLPSGDIYSLELQIDIGDFNNACKDIYNEVERLIRQQIRDNKDRVDVSKTDKILLVGGSCYIPKIREIVETIFNKRAVMDDLSHVVAEGAYIVCSQPNLQNISEPTAFDFGVSIWDEKLQKEVFDVIIPANSPVPSKQPSVSEYTTVCDYQKEIFVDIYEREGNIKGNDLDKCEFFGGFKFTDFKTGKVREPRIKIQFSFDRDRILHVDVIDVRTNSKITQVFSKKKMKIEHRKKVSSPIDFEFLFDTSGSMSGSDIQAVQKAIKNMVNNVLDMSLHRVGIISFNSQGNQKEVIGLTKDKASIIKESLKLEAEGTTYAADALEMANKKLSSCSNRKVVIIFTDGGLHDPDLTRAKADKAKKAGIRIIAVSSDSYAIKDLQKIVSLRDDGKPDVYYINNINELSDTFGNIISSLTKL